MPFVFGPFFVSFVFFLRPLRVCAFVFAPFHLFVACVICYTVNVAR